MRLATISDNESCGLKNSFIQRAEYAGYTIEDIALENDDRSDFKTIISRTHAVVYFPEGGHNLELFHKVVKYSMKNLELRRVLIAVESYEWIEKMFAGRRKELEYLASALFDWTIILVRQNKEKERVPDFKPKLTKFILSQVTDATYIRSAVVVES